MRIARILLGLWLAMAFAACGGGATPDESPPAEEAAAPATTPAETGAPATTRPEVVRPAAAAIQSSASSRFPHTAHTGVACQSCHTSIPGHATHAGVACRACHVPPTRDIASTMARETCQSCHHGSQQTRTCSTCHAPVPAKTVERSLQLSVWSAPRSVSLPFDHARHVSVQCATCHVEPPLLSPDRACGSCHQNHHRPDAACASCHAAPPAGVHDLRVHEGCSGAGCHAETAVADLPESRATCLVCHRDRTDHQPGKDCRSCHWPESGARVP